MKNCVRSENEDWTATEEREKKSSDERIHITSQWLCVWCDWPFVFLFILAHVFSVSFIFAQPRQATVYVFSFFFFALSIYEQCMGCLQPQFFSFRYCLLKIAVIFQVKRIVCQQRFFFSPTFIRCGSNNVRWLLQFLHFRYFSIQFCPQNDVRWLGNVLNVYNETISTKRCHSNHIEQQSNALGFLYIFANVSHGFFSSAPQSYGDKKKNLANIWKQQRSKKKQFVFSLYT